MNAPIRSLKSLDDLAADGLVAADELGALRSVAARYAVSVTPAMAALMPTGDARDPIARQFVPTTAELITRPGERADPIADLPHSPVPGIVHRYPDRALLKLTTLCPVYCRFCFRREMVGPDHGGTLDEAALTAALAYVAATPALREIIVTGGDPLILSPRRIGEVTARLAAIRHVAAIRWHSRVPVVAPERITAELVLALATPGQRVRVAVHANHAREFTTDALAALARLAGGGIGLISQSVLLAGVNDDAVALCDLVQAFRAAGVSPYYLHHLDPAPGTSHFHVPISTGRALMKAVADRLPGQSLPAYTLDIPGGFGKVPLDDAHLTETTPGHYLVRDRTGRAHAYADDAGATPEA